MARRDARHSPRAARRTSRRSPRVRRVVAVVTTLLLLLVAAAVGLGVAWRADVLDPELAERVEAWVEGTPLAGLAPPDPTEEPAQVAPPEGLELPEPATPDQVAEPVSAASAGRPDPEAVRRVLRRALGDRALGPHVVAGVASLDPGAGTPVLLGRGAVVPASTTKLLTAAAALLALGPEARFATTTVLQDSPRGRTVTLVGGGDPLLARVPDDGEGDGGDAAYPRRADLRTLARATAAVLREPGTPGRPGPVRVAVDDTLFAGPAVNPAWEDDYVPSGVVTPIGPLWVDQGFTADRAARVADPAIEAGRVLAAELRRAGVRVAGEVGRRPAPPAATVLARVESPTVAALVRHLVETSDNEVSEVLAHHVGLAVLGEGSFEAGAAATRRVLSRAGVELGGDRLLDGSGLARGNRLSATTLLGVLRAAATRDDLRAVLVGLPVAGFTGSLAARFAQGPPAGLGAVRAKTGTLDGVRALAGLVATADGALLAFALGADRIRDGRDLDASLALDRAAAALAACRCAGAP